MSLGYEQNSTEKKSSGAVVFGEPGVRNYSLDITLENGTRHALNNSYFREAIFEPDEGMILVIFSSKVVVIKGSRLDTLYDGLKRLAVDCIRVSNTALGDNINSGDEIWIESIEVNVANSA